LDNPDIEHEVLKTMNNIALIKKRDIAMPREDAFRLSGPNQMQYVVYWTCLSDFDLTQYYLIDGWSPLTRTQLIEVYSLLLTKALKQYIDEKRKEYTTQGVALPPLFSKILNTISSKVPAVSVTPVGAAEFDENAFPPCVREALHGASSGLRNYAITVLLTSFLSYARVYPSLTAFDPEKKPELSAEQIDILREEVVPLIVEAGNRCEPPLFIDQPIEKANVFYHLGFGLTDTPSHAHFGSSKWYLPPSCKKIRQNAPALCKPDPFCLQGLYIIAEKKKLEHLIATTTGHAKPVLSALQRTRNPRKIADISGDDIGEVKRIMRNLQKNGILIQIRVKNPLVYYIRKIRKKKK
jgi:DNA primase large subunit